MDLEEAKDILDSAIRNELRDHAFGDTEVHWMRNGEEVGPGYFGGGAAEVSVLNNETNERHTFRDEAAYNLRSSGIPGKADRNDSGGPDIYVEGKIMTGLQPRAVRRELFYDL